MNPMSDLGDWTGECYQREPKQQLCIVSNQASAAVNEVKSRKLELISGDNRVFRNNNLYMNLMSDLGAWTGECYEREPKQQLCIVSNQASAAVNEGKSHGLELKSGDKEFFGT